MMIASSGYTPMGEGELPVKEGDVFVIVEKNSETGFWRVRRGTDEGIVPHRILQSKGDKDRQ